MTFRSSLILCLFVSIFSIGEDIKWVSLHQAEKLQTGNPKDIFILYDDGDGKTFYDKHIIKYKTLLSNKYYMVKDTSIIDRLEIRYSDTHFNNNISDVRLTWGLELTSTEFYNLIK